MTAADDLRAAAAYIEKVGWTTGYYEVNGEGTPVCALGGMMRACGLTPYYTGVTPRLAVAKLALRGYLYTQDKDGRITRWNDTEAKDQHEVVVTLEKAAAWIEEQA